MNFRGTAEATIDSKQRLAIPAKFRAKQDPEKDGESWVAFAAQSDVLYVYPVKLYDELSNQLLSRLNPSAEEAENQRRFFGFSEDLEPDSAGRVLVSKELAARAGLKNAVMVVGVGNRLEVHDLERWKAKEAVRASAMGPS